MKKCSKCHTTKEFTEFKKQGKYLGSWCKDCRYQVNRENKYYLNQKHHQQTKEWATKISGVYAIFDNECLYVGESKRVNARIADHKYYAYHPESKVHKINPIYPLLNKHSNLEFKILEETPNHKEREQYWINKLKPKDNA